MSHDKKEGRRRSETEEQVGQEDLQECKSAAVASGMPGPSVIDVLGASLTQRAPLVPMQGGKKRVSLIGPIGKIEGAGGGGTAPATPPAHVRTHKPRSPSTASIYSEEGELHRLGCGPELCDGDLSASACPEQSREGDTQPCGSRKWAPGHCHQACCPPWCVQVWTLPRVSSRCLMWPSPCSTGC